MLSNSEHYFIDHANKQAFAVLTAAAEYNMTQQYLAKIEFSDTAL